ncbi:MAG TPA: trypsin-like peptidase domain-containing protein [Methylomirabilota bacterium]|nr:trypsin-like peptidase domain-containing protein [Methylomirabilota bacterium]
MDTVDAAPPLGPGLEALGIEDVLLYRVCVAAIWADGSMAAAERDHLSHLMDRIAADEDQRHELRRIALHDVSRGSVLAEVSALDAGGRRRLYDRCLATLTADRRLPRAERAFLGRLRRRCGVGFLAHQATVWRAAPVARGLRAAAVVALAVAAAALWTSRHPDTYPPVELAVRNPLALPQADPAAPQLDAESLYETIRHSVVKVNVLVDEARVGHGSGSVLGVDEVGQLYVLTNRHVVYHEVPDPRLLSYEVQLESGIQLPAVLDYYSRSHDLALVLVPNLGGWGLPVPLRLCRDLHVGASVWAVGSPIGLDHSLTSGVVSAVRGAVVQTDATVHSGSSGGPLFDDRGRVCGVVTSSHLQKDFSFALCAEAVLEMLDERAAAQ